MTQASQTGRPAGPTRAPRLDRSSRGALALTGASAIRLTLQFAMLPVLARLIGPSEYGLVALAMPFILLANVLSDGGMGYALGRKQEVSREQESTVFWLSGAIGLTLALMCALAAWPMGRILDEPRLPMLIVALSPILLMNSLTAVSNGRIIRERRFAVFAAGDLISTGAGAATALAAALAGWGAWALVAQQLALWTCKMIWVVWKGGVAVQLHYRFEEARDLMKFGVHTIGAILADFVSRNLDSLIVGGVLGATVLGYYAMAYQIVRAPDMLISGPLYLYIFTAVARAGADPSRHDIHVLATAGLRLGSATLAPLFLGLALVADLAVALVLGDSWQGAVTPMRYLAGAGFSFCMCSIVGTALMGLGHSALRLKLSLLLGAITIAAVALSVRHGLDAVAAAVAGSMAGVCACYILALARDIKVPVRRLIAAFGPAAISSGVMAAAIVATRALVQDAPVGVQFAVLLAAGAAAYLVVIVITGRRCLPADLRAYARAQGEAAPCA